MLTVKEAYRLFLSPKEVTVTLDGRNYDLLPENGYINIVMLDALGDCVVAGIQACEEDCFAIDILLQPVRVCAEALPRACA